MATEPNRVTIHLVYAPVCGLTALKLVSFTILLLVSSAGCQNTSTSIPNPFMADRVPSLPSRVPTATASQPYHQQAPAGAAQLGQSQTPTVAAAATDVAPLPPTDTFRATEPVAPMEGNEVAVQIPTDDDSMRFSPSAETTLAADNVATQPVTNVGMQPAILAPATTEVAFREPAPQPAVPQVASLPTSTAPVAAGTQPTGLFRNPGAPALYEPQPTTTPRIRMPGTEARVREEIVPPAISTTSHQVAYPGASGYVTPASPNQAVTQPQDGFRPRGSSSRESSSPTVPVMQVTPG